MPEGIVDVIPVDLVVARHHRRRRHAARPTPTARPTSCRSPRARPTRCATAASSTSCRLVHRAPALRRPTASRSSCPTGRFPAAAGCRASSSGPRRCSSGPRRCCSALPLRGKQAEFSATLEEKREEVERALGYVELYGAYAECEAIYGVDRLLALLGPLDRRGPGRRSASTRGSIDWDRLRPPTIHLPSVVEHARVRTTPGGTRRRGPRGPRCAARSSSPDRHLAAFDLENTLIASNVVASYSWLATRRLPPRRPAPLRGRRRSPRRPALLALDRADRSDFLRYFYRRYEGAPVDQLDEDAAEMFSELILAKSFPAAIRRVREHRAPRPPHRAHHRRARLRRRAAAPAVRRHRRRRRSAVDADGTLHRRARPTCRPPARPGPRRCSTTPPPHGLDLRESVAYADSTSDLPMLEAVGFPVAVNPETRLAALARKRGWLVEHWRKADGGAARAAADRRTAAPQNGGLANPLVPGARSSARARTDEGAAFERNSPRYAAAIAAGAVDARRRRQGRPAAASATSIRPTCPGPDWVRIRPRLGRHLRQRPRHHRRHARRATSSRSCRSRSCPATRSSADLDRRHRGSCSIPVLGCVDPRHRPGVPRLRARATSTAASASPSATSSPACRAASAATPAAAGRR